MVTPLPHQLPALARHVEVLSKHPASFEASVPGFGKTYVAGFLAQYLKRRPAVVCPKSVITHWHRALGAVGVDPVFVTNYEQAKLDRFTFGRWAIRGRRYEWALPEDALLVIDECHQCKERTTQNAKLMLAAARQQIKTLAVSATAAKDPLDLYSLGMLLQLHTGLDFLGWAFGYGVVRGSFDFKFGGKLRDLERLNAAIFPEHGYRATYDQIPGFPESTIEAYPVTVDDPDKVDEIWQRVQELEEAKVAAEPVVLRLRARQIAELQKVDHFVELARNALDAGESVCIFVNFIDTLEILREKLRAVVVCGGQSPSTRQDAIDSFQEDRARVIVLQSAAGGVGISLHDQRGHHPRRALVSPPESAILLVQILGRIRRVGAKSPAFHQIIFAENTVEKRVCAAVEKKVDQIETINDGDLSPV